MLFSPANVTLFLWDVGTDSVLLPTLTTYYETEGRRVIY